MYQGNQYRKLNTNSQLVAYYATQSSNRVIHEYWLIYSSPAHHNHPPPPNFLLGKAVRNNATFFIIVHKVQQHIFTVASP